jgi:hypothetical protein
VLVQRSHIVLYRFRDNDGAESTAQVYLAASVPIDTALAFAAALRPLMADLSDAPVITFDLVVRLTENNAFIPGTSDVRRAGTFLFRTTNVPLDRYVLNVPSLRLDLVQTSGDYAGVALQLDAPEIIAFVNAMTNGINGVRPVAPWKFYADMGGGGGGWGELGGDGGGWGELGGGGGPWGELGGGGGGWGDDWLDDYYQGDSAFLSDIITAYRGMSNERLYIPERRLQ